MIEYETLGLVAVIVGLLSTQTAIYQRMGNKEHQKIWKILKIVALRSGLSKKEVELID